MVAVVPLGLAPITVAKVLAAHVSGYLNLAADTLAPMEIPAEAMDHRRMQVDAAVLIQAIEAMPLNDYFKIIALLDADLFTPIFTHLLGEARQNGRVALVSLFRLDSPISGAPPRADQILERMAKIALHELGHTLNLLHCEDRQCLMYFSGDVDALDGIPLNYCRYCRASLRRVLRECGPGQPSGC
ncbi:zinc metallopeptidase [Desulfosarcina sp.]|uniref:zinc metallopeptidase n=1 Tax=Desulfosarcina sp. TaxID=2027861 RepID=UPI0039709CB0